MKLFLALALLLLAIPAFRTQAAVEAANGEAVESTTTAAAPVENGEAAESSGTPQTTTPTSFFPVDLLSTFLVDIHYISGQDINGSYIAYHYCYSLTPDFIQCDIYNGIDNDAKLTGVELFTTGDVLQNYSMAERNLWHSHAFAVSNGILVAPELSPADELTLMGNLINTYGKVTRFYPQDPIDPIGPAELVFGWVAQGQVNTTLLQEMDSKLNLTTTYTQRAAARSNLAAPTPIPGVDLFLSSGETPQYQVFNISVSQTSGSPVSGSAVSVPNEGLEEAVETNVTTTAVPVENGEGAEVTTSTSTAAVEQ